MVKTNQKQYLKELKCCRFVQALTLQWSVISDYNSIGFWITKYYKKLLCSVKMSGITNLNKNILLKNKTKSTKTKNKLTWLILKQLFLKTSQNL